MKKLLWVTLIIFIITIIATSGIVYAETGTINTDALNFRTDASTNADIIKKIDKGEKVNILSTTNDWYRISYGGIEGYVKKEFVDIDSSSENANTNNEIEQETTNNQEEDNTSVNQGESISNNEKEESTPIEENLENVNETVVKEEAVLYVLPLLNATKLETLSVSQKVLLISVNGSWAYVQTETSSGWVIKTKLEKSEITLISNNKNNETEKEEPKLNITVTSKEENEEKEKSNIEPVIEEKTENNKEEVVEETGTNTTAPETTTSEYPTTMYANTEDINVRAKPNTESTIVTIVEKGVSIKVVGKESNWYKVETSDGTGYIREDLLSKTK